MYRASLTNAMHTLPEARFPPRHPPLRPAAVRCDTPGLPPARPRRGSTGRERAGQGVGGGSRRRKTGRDIHKTASASRGSDGCVVVARRSDGCDAASSKRSADTVRRWIGPHRPITGKGLFLSLLTAKEPAHRHLLGTWRITTTHGQTPRGRELKQSHPTNNSFREHLAPRVLGQTTWGEGGREGCR